MNLTNGPNKNRRLAAMGICVLVGGAGVASARPAPPVRADLNTDGRVDRADVVILLQSMLSSVSATTASAYQALVAQADVNNDRVLSTIDLQYMLNAMGSAGAQVDLAGVIREVGAPTNFVSQMMRPPAPPTGNGTPGGSSGGTTPPPPGGSSGGTTPPGAAAAWTPQASAWTTFSPSTDTQVVYVSSSLGNDTNSGLSPDLPVKTIRVGAAKLRNNRPDWLLMKRGDVFNENLGTWTKSGKSQTEPMVIGVFGPGTERAKLMTGTSSAFNMTEPNGIKNIAILSLEMTPEAYTGTQRAQGIRWVGPGENLLIEDCKLTGYQTNIVVQGTPTGTFKNVAIRRNVIADAYAIGDHSQGIFMTRVDGILIEENVLDHNGWREGVAGAEATIFNHNIYLTKDTTPNTIVRGNISANASSHGMQMRRGGVCENNLLIGNPINILFGQFQSAWPAQAATGTITRNVIMDSRNIANQARGFGIWFQMADGVVASQNLIANQVAGGGPVAVCADATYRDVRLERNVVFNWSRSTGGGATFRFAGTAQGNVTLAQNTVAQTNGASIVEHMVAPPADVFRFVSNRYNTTAVANRWFRVGTTPYTLAAWASVSGDANSVGAPTSFPDSTRSVAKYNRVRGGEESVAGFLAEARKQSRGSWKTEYTAFAANQWIRAGFGLN